MGRKEDKTIEAAITIAVLSVILIPALLGWQLIIINLPVAIIAAYVSWKSMECSIEQSKSILLWGAIAMGIITTAEVVIILNDFASSFTFSQPRQPRQ